MTRLPTCKLISKHATDSSTYSIRKCAAVCCVANPPIFSMSSKGPSRAPGKPGARSASPTKMRANVGSPASARGSPASARGMKKEAKEKPTPALAALSELAPPAPAAVSSEGDLDDECTDVASLKKALAAVRQERDALRKEHEADTQSLRSAVAKSESIRRVSHSIASEIRVHALLEKVMGEARTLLTAERCTMYVCDHETHELWSTVAEGVQGTIRLPIGQGVAGACAKSGQLINVKDAASDERISQKSIGGFDTRNMLCVPVLDHRVAEHDEFHEQLIGHGVTRAGDSISRGRWLVEHYSRLCSLAVGAPCNGLACILQMAGAQVVGG